MPTHDRILTSATCYNGHSCPAQVQFGYGPVDYRDVMIGDVIDWTYSGRATYGAPGNRRVRALASVLARPEHEKPTRDCPVCGCPYPAYVVEIENDRIARIRPVRDGEKQELQEQEYEFTIDD